MLFIAEQLQAAPNLGSPRCCNEPTVSAPALLAALPCVCLGCSLAPVRHDAPCCALTGASVAVVAYRRRMKNKKIPDGWELIEEVVEDFEAQMKEAVNEEHEGRRKNELTWKIHRIHWEKNRFLYDLMYVRKVMSRELVRRRLAALAATSLFGLEGWSVDGGWGTNRPACARERSMTGWCARRSRTARSLPSGASRATRSCAPCWPSRRATTTLARPRTAGAHSGRPSWCQAVCSLPKTGSLAGTSRANYRHV